MKFEQPFQETESEKKPLEIFREACNNRLDELVQEGVYPQHFAEERKQAAAKIETNLPDDPQKAGNDFAEIGMLGIIEFKKVLIQ